MLFGWFMSWALDPGHERHGLIIYFGGILVLACEGVGYLWLAVYFLTPCSTMPP